MRKIPVLLLLSALAFASSGVGECREVLRDTGFDAWCGTKPCYWEVEEGEVHKAATWHESDTGFAFVGDRVTISQVNRDAWSDGACIAFDVVADIAVNAQVTLELDAFDDGSVDHTERFPTASWRKLEYRVHFAGEYQGLRFRLIKVGGRAVLASLNVRSVSGSECAGDRIKLAPRLNGTPCYRDESCSSNKCVEGADGGTCGDCETDADCAGGSICGIVGTARASLGLWPTCVAPGSSPANAACNRDEQCATGMCDEGACGVCDGSDDCDGAACTAVLYPHELTPGRVLVLSGAKHCAAGAPKVARGGACLANDDCVSGRCHGAPLGLCTSSFSHRRCTTSADCPAPSTEETSSCIFAGISGGVCQ